MESVTNLEAELNKWLINAVNTRNTLKRVFSISNYWYCWKTFKGQSSPRISRANTKMRRWLVFSWGPNTRRTSSMPWICNSSIKRVWNSRQSELNSKAIEHFWFGQKLDSQRFISKVKFIVKSANRDQPKNKRENPNQLRVSSKIKKVFDCSSFKVMYKYLNIWLSIAGQQ